MFVTGNPALTMLDLSHKYFTADSSEQGMLLAAAGEAISAKGSHGRLGVFIGVAHPTVANVMISCVMLNGKVYNHTTSSIGIIGNSVMMVYFIMVTFMPDV